MRSSQSSNSACTRRRALGRSLPAATLAALVACDGSTTSTQIVVVVDSSLRAGSELSQIDVALYEPDGTGDALKIQTFALADEADKSAKLFPLPLSFALAPSSDKSTRAFRLVVSGSGSYQGRSGKIVETQLTSAFQPQKALRLDVFLSASCAGNFCSSDASGVALSTCVDGDCVSVPDRSDLPALEGGALGGYDTPTIPIGDDEDAGQTPGKDAGDGPDADTPPPVDMDGGEVLDGGDAGVVPDAGPDAEVDAGPCPSTGCVCAPGSVDSGGMCVDVDECTDPVNLMVCTPTGYTCEETAAPGYTCRGHRADWRMPDSVVGAAARPDLRAVGSGESGTVNDAITGLEWRRNVQRSGNTNTFTYEQASCETGWRLPSLIELMSLIDTTRALVGTGGSMLDAAFQQQGGLYWTSTLDPTVPTLHRQVSFSDGTAPVASMAAPANAKVRCVRSPNAVAAGTPPTRFTPVNNTQGALIAQRDQRTRLGWLIETRATPASYADANAFCAELATKYAVSARLPTYKELLTLLSFGGSAPYVDAPFAASSAGNFWSATSALGVASGGFVVNFSTGAGSLADQTGAAGVRCVVSGL